MTEEDAFQAALDANPDDHTTRLVFADWLEERGDDRAAGMRALGLLQRSAYNWVACYTSRFPSKKAAWRGCVGWIFHNGTCTNGGVEGNLYRIPQRHAIPEVWLRKIKGSWSVMTNTNVQSRRECEDEAARAFSKLTAAEQEEILAVVAAIR